MHTTSLSANNSASANHSAKLFYLVGPSGAGKDSLINALRKQPLSCSLYIAPRYITRAPDSTAEDHIALSPTEFSEQKQQGLFAMQWQANGYQYGVGNEVNRQLDNGVSVLFNGSRAHISLARQLFGARLRMIALEVSADVLAERLRRRGRESEAEIMARLTRNQHYQSSLPLDCWRLDNNHSLTETTARLIAYIQSQTTEQSLSNKQQRELCIR
ncbi:ribose 1,5-bisphosphokinase [Motilimonas sp. 1_MG-2023]|uniref:ribose 1,5-bisphosphokinase n=1 Tax=Motilimonas sp. 1_MG-2023 TaxID=3062672 RepID=UPI0026E31F0F|nr:ribose 1,5-bisphosphokinase [Motilimonas sp. 1_MG-2023]MDO6527251.1 ribose 1,5-bisphosphokinase [Motilimonas sp. 1_MG-2023]